MSKNPEQFLAEVMVQSWDQHIGEDGARAIVREMDKAGLAIVPKVPSQAMINAYCETHERLGIRSWANASVTWPAMLAASSTNTQQ